MAYLEVGPAYGRDYRNQKDAQADWDADKDFTVHEGSSLPFPVRYGQATNRADVKRIEAEHGEKINVVIRYDRKMKVMTAK